MGAGGETKEESGRRVAKEIPPFHTFGSKRALGIEVFRTFPRSLHDGVAVTGWYESWW